MREPSSAPTASAHGLVVRLIAVCGLLVVVALLGSGVLRGLSGKAAPAESDLSPVAMVDPVLRGTARQSPAPEATDGDMAAWNADRIAILGQVLGSDLIPQEDAVVRLRAADRPESTTRTDASGRFSLELGARPTSLVHCALVATGSNGEAGDAAVQVHPRSHVAIHLGTLVLRASGDVPVVVTHDSQPVAGARVFATSVPIRHATGAPAWVGKPWSGWSHAGVSDESGTAVLRDVPNGALRIMAVADGPLRGESEVRTDRLDPPVVVELRTARDLRIEVVRASDGAPVPGCHIGAVGRHRLLEEPWARAVTDGDGVAVLPNAPREEIELLIAGPDWSSAFVGMRREVPADVVTFRTEVPEPIRVEVPIEVAEGPWPEDGTPVRLDQHNWAWWPGTRCWLAREGAVRGDRLVVESYSPSAPVRALARLPDGRVGHVSFQMPKGPGKTVAAQGSVVFGRSRSVSVRVRERGTGNPAVGVAVTLTVHPGPQQLGPVRTDGAGYARIDGAPASSCVVNLCSNPDWVEEHRQHVFAPGAAVDLTQGDASLDLEVEPILDAVVHVRTEGRQALPTGLDVLLFYWPQAVEGVRPADLRLLPDRGELWFRVRNPLSNPRPPLQGNEALAPQLHLSITSDSHATETITLQYTPGESRLVGDVDLVPAGSLITRVQTTQEGHFAFQLERHDTGKGWTRVDAVPLARFANEPSQDCYEGLRLGRYRLRETRLDVSSPEVFLHGGTEPAMLTWELESVQYAEGAVVLPAGVDPAGLAIHAWTLTDPPQLAGSATIHGAEFRLPVPKQCNLRIQAYHPKCRSVGEEDQALVSGPTQGLQLRMTLR